MPADDLSGISELDDRRRAVLAQGLGITSCYELILADRQRIADAFGRRAIRPTLEEVTVWQDEARRIRAASIDASVSAAAASGWQSAASFVVAFEERGRQDALERRIVAELAEIEPEASPQDRSEWPGWACADACHWMLGRVGAAAAPATPAQTVPVAEAGAPETGAMEARTAGERPKIDIERVRLADSSGGIELVADSRPVPQDRFVWAQPARLIVTLGSGTAGPRASVALQLVPADGRKRNIAGQLDDTGRVAKVELSGLAGGEYRPTIVAWTPDGSFLSRIVKLPAVEVVGLATGQGGSP